MANKRLRLYQFYELKGRAALTKFVEVVAEYTTILEIGAGTGVITHAISSKLNRKIDVCEKNKQFHSWLKPYSDRIYGDFFKIELEELCKYECVFGSLPYRYAIDIILRISEMPFKRGIFMLQKEIGQKLLQEGQGLSRLKLKVLNRLKIIESVVVPANSFKPVPRVDGMIIVVEPVNPRYDITKLNSVLRIFCYPRKRLGKIYVLLKLKLTLYIDKRSAQLNQAEFDLIYSNWPVQAD